MLALWAVYFGNYYYMLNGWNRALVPCGDKQNSYQESPQKKRDLVWMGPTIPSDNIPKKSLFHDDFLEVNNFSSGGVNRDCLYPMTNQNFGILLKL